MHIYMSWGGNYFPLSWGPIIVGPFAVRGPFKGVAQGGMSFGCFHEMFSTETDNTLFHVCCVVCLACGIHGGS